MCCKVFADLSTFYSNHHCHPMGGKHSTIWHSLLRWVKTLFRRGTWILPQQRPPLAILTCLACVLISASVPWRKSQEELLGKAFWAKSWQESHEFYLNNVKALCSSSASQLRTGIRFRMVVGKGSTSSPQLDAQSSVYTALLQRRKPNLVHTSFQRVGMLRAQGSQASSWPKTYFFLFYHF